MDCKKAMRQNRLDSGSDEKSIQEIAKLTINFLTKHNMPLTPINYDEWFFVICKAVQERHILSDKNLRILYKKYRQDLRDAIELEREEIKEISVSLKDVAEESSEILENFGTNIRRHTHLIGESIEALDNKDLQRMEELRKKIEKLEEENRKLKEYLENNRKRLEIIEAKFAETRKEADLDALTRVFNRKKLERDQKEFELGCSTYSVIFLDIDNFKKINDTYGHTIGDKVLQEVGEILTNYVRRNTYSYRYGGEEFVIVLPDGDINAAKVVAERLRGVIENRGVTLDNHNTLHFTASFGAAQKREGESFEDVLQRADQALYEAKRNGKNRVVTK
ncbi:MAG: diguanylate cyclase [Epsilonproteobacteria bacterium]|nr:diguanylate cyclase [Campylobacterota bacterium]